MDLKEPYTTGDAHCHHLANTIEIIPRRRCGLMPNYCGHLLRLATSDTGVDKGAGGPGPQWPGKKERKGYFYQMSNMYTCIAYLIEIRQFCSKTWFIKVLILRPKML